jgi:hypothetical protein
MRECAVALVTLEVCPPSASMELMIAVCVFSPDTDTRLCRILLMHRVGRPTTSPARRSFVTACPRPTSSACRYFRRSVLAQSKTHGLSFFESLSLATHRRCGSTSSPCPCAAPLSTLVSFCPPYMPSSACPSPSSSWLSALAAFTDFNKNCVVLSQELCDGVGAADAAPA